MKGSPNKETTPLSEIKTVDDLKGMKMDEVVFLLIEAVNQLNEVEDKVITDNN